MTVRHKGQNSVTGLFIGGAVVDNKNPRKKYTIAHVYAFSTAFPDK